MTDPFGALHRALQTYLAMVALLGLATLAWSVTNIVVLDDVTLASVWFAVAGSGTLLVAVLIFRHAYVEESEADEPETVSGTP